MVLLIDSNVILDVLANRPEFVKDSSVVWKLCETGKARGFISALTFSNTVYVLRKELGPSQIKNIFEKLNLIFEFTELTPKDLHIAAKMGWKDYEDATQSATAWRLEADYIVTRNVKDFAGSPIEAITPFDLISRLA